MTKAYALGLAGGALATLAMMAATPAEARCSISTAAGFGFTRPMAMEMAKLAVDSEIAFKGKKAKGRVHYKCGVPFMSECRASRRAC